VKVEGSGPLGVRRLVLFGLRDPVAISHREALFADIHQEVVRIMGSNGWQLHFSTFGADAVLGEREPVRTEPHEVAVLAEVIAPSAEEARKVAELVKYGSLRAHYEGKLTSAGGAALPGDEVLSPDQDAYEWTIDHLVELRDPLESCRIDYEVM
jgi:hypothetical protein